MSIEFLLTSLVVVTSPGTGVLVTLAAGLSRGARASIVAALGSPIGMSTATTASSGNASSSVENRGKRTVGRVV